MPLDDLPDWLPAWCLDHLGGEPADVLFLLRQMSEVFGLRLADGTEAVVKARADGDRVVSCVAAQARLAERGFPCARPLTPVVGVGSLAVHAEEFRPGGDVLHGDSRDVAVCYARVFARLMAELIDEREVLAAMLDREPDLTADRPGLLIITDKGFASTQFETDLALKGATLLRPSFTRERRRPGESLLTSVRQLIESVNDTLKGQLDLERHGGRTFAGVAVRVAQRILAMATAIWHNHKTSAPVLRSLIAFDH